MPVPNTFANATATIPLSQLDANFATTITLGNTAIQLGNTVTTLNNMTLANVTVTSGNVTITNVSVTTANVTTANIATAQIANVTVSGTGTFAAGSNTAPSITTSGDTNTGIFFPAADTIAFTEGGVESMRIDASGNVGIGTSSPALPIDVVSNSGSLALSIRGRSSDDIGTLMYYTNNGVTNTAQIQMRPNDNEFRFAALGARSQTFYTNGSERMRIDASGNLGLGATPSAWQANNRAVQLLEGWASLSANNSQGCCDLANNGYNSGSSANNLWKYTNGSQPATLYQQNAGQHRWFYAASGAANATITFTQAMTLDASGNLGVGTASPSQRFDAQVATGTEGSGLAVSNSEAGGYGSGVSFYSYRTDGTTKLMAGQVSMLGAASWSSATFTSSHMLFKTVNQNTLAERARITSGGQLLVGTTTGQQNTEIAAFTNAGGGSIVLRIQRSGENNAYIASSTAQPFQVWDSGIVQRFVVTSAGTCLNTTGTYGTLSDAKLKENIVDATPKLDDLMKVKVRNYELKSEPNSKYLGFVAQELREIFPAMIDETEDEDDNGEKTGEVTLSVKTTVFIPMLVKAIQELNAKVEALEAQLKGNA